MLDWVAILMQILPAYFTQTFIHEGSHAVFAIAHGMRITSFKIWPHFVYSASGERRLFWGRITYTPNPGVASTNRERVWRSIAPFVVSGPIWIIVYLTHWDWPQLPPSALSGVVAFWTACTVDLIRGLLISLATEPRGDLSNAITIGNWPRHQMAAISIILSSGLFYAWALVVGRIVRASF